VAIAVLRTEAFGKSRLMDVQGVVILIFRPHFRICSLFLCFSRELGTEGGGPWKLTF
jgi:hypothetical protein